MSTKYAYIDEFGAYGFNFESEGCSSHFIVTAIIVDKDDISLVEEGIIYEYTQEE